MALGMAPVCTPLDGTALQVVVNQQLGFPVSCPGNLKIRSYSCILHPEESYLLLQVGREVPSQSATARISKSKAQLLNGLSGFDSPLANASPNPLRVCIGGPTKGDAPVESKGSCTGCRSVQAERSSTSEGLQHVEQEASEEHQEHR